ncbi:MAG: ABC transporter substrate-binding protein [Chloroflexi bacterium]|nr:ABC transporter substrate-binding protein [Chloroflexota bacterium]
MACAGPASTPTNSGAPPSAASNPPVTKKITFVTPNPSAIVVFNLCAAIGEGYLAQEGIEVTFQALDGSGPVLQAMAAGQAQIGLPGPAPVLLARARGEKPVMFYNLYAQSLFGLVVPADSSIQSPADLKGATIGVGTAGGAEVPFARAILKEAGLTENTDYTFLPVGDGGQAAAAFTRKEVVAYAAAIPDMAIMRTRGMNLREITPDKFLAFFGNGYTTLQATIDSDPGLIGGFARALVRGMEFASNNKAGTLSDCAKLNPQEAADTTLSSALYDASLARSKPPGGAAPGTFSASGWQTWQDSLVASGDLKAPLSDLASASTNTFVEQAAP